MCRSRSEKKKCGGDDTVVNSCSESFASFPSSGRAPPPLFWAREIKFPFEFPRIDGVGSQKFIRGSVKKGLAIGIPSINRFFSAVRPFPFLSPADVN